MNHLHEFENIYDHFQRVDERTVLETMDLKDLDQFFFFPLQKQ